MVMQSIRRRQRRRLLLVSLCILLGGYLCWVWYNWPAQLASARHWKYDPQFVIRRVLADGIIAMHYGQSGPQYLCHLDWNGHERWRIQPLPDSSVFEKDALSPDRRTLALFCAGSHEVTVITRHDEQEISRVSFPLSLLHPPKKYEIAEQFDVAVDNTGCVMIACPNAVSVSLVAVQYEKVLATGHFTSGIDIPEEHENFYSTLSSDGSVVVAHNTNYGKAQYEYRNIHLAGQQITTTVRQAGTYDGYFGAAGIGDGLIQRDCDGSGRLTLKSVLSNQCRFHPSYAGMYLLNNPQIAGGWVALQAQKGAPVIVHNVMSGNTWQFRGGASIREVLITPDGRYALCVERIMGTTQEKLKKSMSSLAMQKAIFSAPDIKLSIFERPGRLRARGYCQYQQYPDPSLKWARGYVYYFSPDGKKVIEQCEKNGTTVFSW